MAPLMKRLELGSNDKDAKLTLNTKLFLMHPLSSHVIPQR